MYTPPDKQIYGDSATYKNWMSTLSMTTCRDCKKLHGTIYLIHEPPYVTMLHPNCNCSLVPMRTKKLGYVTQERWNGADVFIACLGKLPDNYITKDEAIAKEWRSYEGNLHDVLPGKIIGGDIFENDLKKLPEAFGRTWFEADINYEGGYRNDSRILYSSDGLIFATYDHYKTFYEVLQ